MTEPAYRHIIEGLPDTAANREWLQAHFECAQCGDCCRIHTIGVRITHPEMERLAQREHLSTPEYLATILTDGETYIVPQPCRYLINNSCTMHDIKPSVCSKYPFHQYKTVDRDTAWVVISECLGSLKLLKMLTSGKQLGLEYRPYC
jgi:Fe-S-cluster containining protein